MQTKIQKWGNSLALRIPKAFADETGLTDDASVEIQLVNGEIRIRLLNPAQYDLDSLLTHVTADNLHGEVDAGSPVGGEVW